MSWYMTTTQPSMVMHWKMVSQDWTMLSKRVNPKDTDSGGRGWTLTVYPAGGSHSFPQYVGTMPTPSTSMALHV
jgi:hypothetical protein